jgi:hypothetical protein
MSGRLLSSRLAPIARQASLQALRRQPFHTPSAAGGLLRQGATLKWRPRKPWPHGSYGIHNVPAVRHASFARIIPQLAMKLLRVPAMFGAVAIGGLAYIQYQAAQAGNYALDLFGRAKDTVSTGGSAVVEGAGDFFGRIGNGWDKTKKDVELPAWLQTMFTREE